MSLAPSNDELVKLCVDGARAARAVRRSSRLQAQAIEAPPDSPVEASPKRRKTAAKAKLKPQPEAPATPCAHTHPRPLAPPRFTAGWPTLVDLGDMVSAVLVKRPSAVIKSPVRCVP